MQGLGNLKIVVNLNIKNILMFFLFPTDVTYKEKCQIQEKWNIVNRKSLSYICKFPVNFTVFINVYFLKEVPKQTANIELDSSILS